MSATISYDAQLRQARQHAGVPTFTFPPLDHSLTLQEIYRWHATHSAKHPLFVFEDAPGKLRVITWEEVNLGIDKAARLCAEKAAAEGTEDSKVIAVLGSLDSITFTCLAVGIMRAGYIFFPISPRNSPAAVSHLLVQTKTRHVFVTPDQANQTLFASANELLKDSFNVALHVTPSFEDLFPNSDGIEPEAPFVSPKRTPNDVAAIFHSSGTTAFPKPITYTNRAFIDFGTMPRCSDVDLCGKVLGVHAVPLFHAMASIQMTFSASIGLTLAVFKPHTPPVFPTSDTTLHGIEVTRCEYALVTPMFIELWARDARAVDALSKLKGLLHGGGPLAKEAGDLVASKGVELISVYATTETIFISHFIPSDIGQDWEYFRFAPNRVVWVIDNGDDEYTIAMMCSEAFRPNFINTTIDGVEGYHTNDVLKKHPSRDGFWRVVGRADDQIIHSTGEKTNPGPLEKIFLSDPHVSGAVIFGQGRFNCGVLVCPSERFVFDPNDKPKLAEYRSLIWPTVERANAYAPSHSRLFKEMIVVTSPSKPLTYTGKGTIRRQASINEYEEEINAAYDAVKESSQEDITPPAGWDLPSTRDFVREVAKRTMRKEAQNAADDVDLFEVGLDSLQATWIRNTILHALRKDYSTVVRRLSLNMVYEHPTIASLALYLSTSVMGVGNGSTMSIDQKRRELTAMVEKYTKDIPRFLGKEEINHEPGKVILLTGGTGSLGSNILAHLLQTEDVSRVYAFSRPAAGSSASAKDRHVQAFERDGLPLHLLSDARVKFVNGDSALDNFGLAPDEFEKLRDEVTHIVHNGWRININLSLSSFESNIKGVRSFVDFCMASRRAKPPRILFVSSIGVVQNCVDEGAVPELAFQSPDTALGSGYTESKWVSERILQAAREQSLSTTIVRCGQMTGGRTGAWNKHEWFPSIVKSSISLGMFPSVEGDVSWLSASDAAGALVEMLDAKEDVLHLVHPRPVPWNDIASCFANALQLPLAPYNKWLDALERTLSETGSDPASVEKAFKAIPALRLIDFFRSAKKQATNPDREPLGIPRLASEKAQACSASLWAAKAMGADDVDRWLDSWRRSGFLSSS